MKHEITPNKILIGPTDQPPLLLEADEWSLIGRANKFVPDPDQHDGAWDDYHWSDMALVRVRRHEDGRTVVYGCTESCTETEYQAYEVLAAQDAARDGILHASVRRICLKIGKTELASSVLTSLRSTRRIR